MYSFYKSTLTLCFLGFCHIGWFQKATTAQVVEVPAWAKEAIWYQIFPDRFRNGDTINDPKLKDILGCWPHDSVTPWAISPWNSDWYQRQPWEENNGYDIGGTITRRRYGGDIQGMLDQLDYLQALGINAIYLNPVFWAPSLHRYDAILYHHIDPHLGPDPEGDKEKIALENPIDPSTWVWTSADLLMLKFIEECHIRHIRVIFDGVFNHMGVGSFAFRDLKQNQQASAYKDWFTVYSWDSDTSHFSYQGWFGVPDLPELREDSLGLAPGPKQYVFDCTQRWMQPDGRVDRGIDGWRLDVAFCIAHPFWKDWRQLVKALNPEAYITAEVVDRIEVVKPYLQGDEFDAVMNYGWAVIASEFFINQKNRISVTAFDSLLRELRQAFPGDISYVQQNLFDSHDTQRFTSFLVNPDIASFRQWGDYFGKTKADNPDYLVRKPTEAEYRLQKLMALFQFTYVGAPMIYYGDEVGMWGANDPDCRKPMVWADIAYEPEVFYPDQTKHQPDLVEPLLDLYRHYADLAEMRRKYPVLSHGNIETLYMNNDTQVYVYRRSLPNHKPLIVILNNGLQDQDISLRDWAIGGAYLVLQNLVLLPEGHVVVRVPHQSGMVLEVRDSDQE